MFYVCCQCIYWQHGHLLCGLCSGTQSRSTTDGVVLLSGHCNTSSITQHEMLPGGQA